MRQLLVSVLLTASLLAAFVDCVTGLQPTPPDHVDGSTRSDISGCSGGFPSAGDVCMDGESCTAEGDCSQGGTLPTYGCQAGKLVKVGTYQCPSTDASKPADAMPLDDGGADAPAG